jgi:hypothetical protein
MVLHAPYAPVVHREDAREAIRSSMTSEQYAVPDDEDPIEDNLTEVLAMVGLERASKVLTDSRVAIAQERYFRCPARQTRMAGGGGPDRPRR